MIKLSLGSDGEMLASIPSYLDDREQHVSIPLTLDGLRILKRILVSRDKGNVRLGDEGEPTQALVHQWLKAERARELNAVAQSAEDLGLEIEI